MSLGLEREFKGYLVVVESIAAVLSGKQLRSFEWGGARSQPQARPHMLARGAKVPELDVPILEAHDVARLQVAVHDVAAVQVVQGEEDLLGNLANPLLVQALAVRVVQLIVQITCSMQMFV